MVLYLVNQKIFCKKVKENALPAFVKKDEST